ncbi:hypothetical protein HYH03_011568 [Edaphochlamys debaryana]|uniref:Uncharacterized protein n=1 Tax=Edaphochlamys debaryana TaxID=47281 RepID=A0A835XX17_9CHLO|nr:hypothetical protein HYH03_011568 [Edaphochlamys debaryana]|eukprot:KAG2489936.1 hypothetical protein HYH03_011568 [Edaphochlamys debaryana]
MGRFWESVKAVLVVRYRDPDAVLREYGSWKSPDEAEARPACRLWAGRLHVRARLVRSLTAVAAGRDANGAGGRASPSDALLNFGGTAALEVSHVLAFSPGFMRPPQEAAAGQGPRRLQGGHTIPRPVAAEALAWFLGDPGQ